MRERGHSLLRRVWASEILLTLEPGAMRFNPLMAAIPGISDRMLTERLRELELAGLVKREVVGGPPIGVFYRITGSGLSCVPALRELSETEKFVNAMEAALR